VHARVYEVRTGRLLLDTTVEINGASCPQTLTFRSDYGLEPVIGPTQYVTPSDAQIQDAFRPLISP
jgi:hypothetical protein